MNRHHPNRKRRLRREYLPPYVVLEDKKEVLFFMLYLKTSPVEI